MLLSFPIEPCLSLLLGNNGEHVNLILARIIENTDAADTKSVLRPLETSEPFDSTTAYVCWCHAQPLQDISYLSSVICSQLPEVLHGVRC